MTQQEHQGSTEDRAGRDGIAAGGILILTIALIVFLIIQIV